MTAPATPAEPVKAARPDWAPESFWDADKGTFKPEMGQNYKDLATFKATEDSRRLTLPKTPDEYVPQLPKDFQAPQGIEYKIDANNPVMAQARQFAHEAGLSQEQFGKMLSLHAAMEIGNLQSMKTVFDGEVAKLGAAGTARVTAVQNFLNAQLGEDLGKDIAAMMITAKRVQGFEQLMANFRNQGSGSFQPARAPSEPARVSPEQYAKMTYSERKDYAAQFNGSGTSH